VYRFIFLGEVASTHTTCSDQCAGDYDVAGDCDVAGDFSFADDCVVAGDYGMLRHKSLLN